MYQLLRDVHLALGLFASLFLLVYGISAFQMAHPPLFRWIGPTKTESTIELRELESAREIARRLMDEHDLRGDLMEVETTSIAVRLQIVRPGVVHRVSIDTRTHIASVWSERSDLIGTLNRIHHVSGMWHDHWLTNGWAVLLALVSLGLFGTGITGLYLSLKRAASRKLALALLTLSLVWGGSLLLTVRLL